MKLYYSPGVCSLSPHIVLREAGFDFELEKVDLKTKTTALGRNYNEITRKSAVPLLVLDNGEQLTEGVAIIQYLADLNPETKLAPRNSTFERVRLQEWLNYISTEIHKSFSPLFHPELGEKTSDYFRQKVRNTFDYVSDALKGKQYLFGNQFTVADAYLYTVVNWHNFVGIDLSSWPVLVEYQQRVAARPRVREALQAEGLLKTKAA